MKPHRRSWIHHPKYLANPRGKLQRLAERLGVTHAPYSKRGGEIVEYRLGARKGRILPAAVKAMDRLNEVKDAIPSIAFVSARFELAPDRDSRENYKTIGGMHYVPTNGYKAQNLGVFGAAVLRIANNVERTQEPLGIVIRIAIPPPGFLGVSGDALIGG